MSQTDADASRGALKPCPWCSSYRAGSAVVHDNGAGYYAECLWCHARGPIETVAADAITTWNRRADASAAGAGEAVYDPNETFGVTREMINKARNVLAEGLTTAANDIDSLVFCVLRECEKIRRATPPPGADPQPPINERIKAAMANQACTDDLNRVNRSPDDCPVGCPIHSKEGASAEEVEDRVARALTAQFHGADMWERQKAIEGTHYHDYWRDMARAAIAAMGRGG